MSIIRRSDDTENIIYRPAAWSVSRGRGPAGRDVEKHFRYPDHQQQRCAVLSTRRSIRIRERDRPPAATRPARGTSPSPTSDDPALLATTHAERRLTYVYHPHRASAPGSPSPRPRDGPRKKTPTRRREPSKSITLHTAATAGSLRTSRQASAPRRRRRDGDADAGRNLRVQRPQHTPTRRETGTARQRHARAAGAH
jgi:hypothetical protein